MPHFLVFVATALATPLWAAEAVGVTFEKDIQPMLEHYCYRCHGEEKQKGDLNLSHFADASGVFAEREVWLEVFRLVEEEEMPNKELLPSRKERQLLLKWIDQTINAIDWSKVRDAGHVTMPRLTKTEYNNTMRDLLGMDLNPGATLALPYLEIMGKGGVAAAATPVADGIMAPTRLLCVFQPNGVYPKAWDVKGQGMDYEISKILDPPERLWIPPTQPGEQDMVRPPEGIPRSCDEHLRLMMDIMVLSFWTDTTRVGTLMTAHGFSRQNFSFIEGVTNDHHGMSHHKEQEGAVSEYTRGSHWDMKQFAYLLEKMRSIDEGIGTLLDNSMVLYGSGMKDGNGHKRDNLPILMAGRGGGSLPPGGHVQLKSQSLANLHLTVAQKFGIETDDFNGVGKSAINELG